MPLTAKNFGKIAGATLLYLAAADIVGVLACLFFEIFHERSSSAALFYVLWFVLGVFCGILIYTTGGSIAAGKSAEDWSKRPDARKIGFFVIADTFCVLVALSILFHLLQWRYHPQSDYYVPDTAPVSLTFFITVFVSVVFAHNVMSDKPKKRA